MIFDRTAEDVEQARTLRAKLGNGETLTESEYTTLERGTMTLTTLNRIDGKTDEINELLTAMGYYGANIVTKTWTKEDIFNSDNFKQIIKNLVSLRNAFYVYSDTPITPEAQYHYEAINKIEKILYDLREMVDDVKGNYRICGTFECGE